MSSIKETVTRTLSAQNETEYKESSSPKTAGKLTYRNYMQRSKSKPATGSCHGRSPILQKEFDANDGLGMTQIQPTVMISPSNPIYPIVAINSNGSNSSPNTTKLMKYAIVDRGSMHS